jgi:hypothetical protein
MEGDSPIDALSLEDGRCRGLGEVIARAALVRNLLRQSGRMQLPPAVAVPRQPTL